MRKGEKVGWGRQKRVGSKKKGRLERWGQGSWLRQRGRGDVEESAGTDGDRARARGRRARARRGVRPEGVEGRTRRRAACSRAKSGVASAEKWKRKRKRKRGMRGVRPCIAKKGVRKRHALLREAPRRERRRREDAARPRRTSSEMEKGEQGTERGSALGGVNLGQRCGHLVTARMNEKTGEKGSETGRRRGNGQVGRKRKVEQGGTDACRENVQREEGKTERMERAGELQGRA